MNTDEIFKIVAIELSSIFKCNLSDIKPHTCAADIDLWDSLNNIKMLLLLEKKFGIRFTGIDASSLENVGELVALIFLKSNAGK